jgi:23S rRNA (adenine2503-C2)-methyltransferase
MPLDGAPLSEVTSEPSKNLEVAAGTLDLFAFCRKTLGEEIQNRYGEPVFRATQLFQWIYKRKVSDLSEMTDLSKRFRDALIQDLVLPRGRIHSRQVSSDGTRKYLIEVEGGDLVETVLIKQPRRNTLCVSSQVGCAMGCKFCRTATMGLRRHLSAS